MYDREVRSGNSRRKVRNRGGGGNHQTDRSSHGDKIKAVALGVPPIGF